jgi:malonyl CoA-acyl carrier protein transacylase
MSATSATPLSSPASAAGPLRAGPAAAGSVLLFPGQGSQTPAMRDLVVQHRPDLLGLAAEACGRDPFEHLAEGTAFAQPAMYAASIAAWERAGRPEAAATAGHSLGELAALAVGGALDHHEGLAVAVERGRLMQRAAERSQPGGMVAVLGEEADGVRLARELELTVANHNAPGQLVLSGPSRRIDEAAERARHYGLKSMRLPIAGAFHSPWMEGAVEPFRRALDRMGLRPPRIPVFSSTAAAPFEDIPETLAAALVSPVRWTDTLRALHEAGARRFVEPGPGRVLTGLVKRTLEGVEATALEARGD